MSKHLRKPFEWDDNKGNKTFNVCNSTSETLKDHKRNKDEPFDHNGTV